MTRLRVGLSYSHQQQKIVLQSKSMNFPVTRSTDWVSISKSFLALLVSFSPFFPLLFGRAPSASLGVVVYADAPTLAPPKASSEPLFQRRPSEHRTDREHEVRAGAARCSRQRSMATFLQMPPPRPPPPHSRHRHFFDRQFGCFCLHVGSCRDSREL